MRSTPFFSSKRDLLPVKSRGMKTHTPTASAYQRIRPWRITVHRLSGLRHPAHVTPRRNNVVRIKRRLQALVQFAQRAASSGTNQVHVVDAQPVRGPTLTQAGFDQVAVAALGAGHFAWIRGIEQQRDGGRQYTRRARGNGE